MIRARFFVNDVDPRPVSWPIRHPYWVTGYGDDFAVVVAYADDEAEIRRLWPEAIIQSSDFADGYVFTDRFSKPDWFQGAAA